MVRDSIFSGNSVTFYGGGIYNDGGTVTVSNSTLSGNSASQGGGMFNQDGALTVSDSEITGNTAIDFGGGTANFGELTLRDSEVTDVRQLGRSLYQFPVNFIESYFPTRLVTDFAAPV